MIERLDHLVLTVANIQRTVHRTQPCAFHERVLGMRHQSFGAQGSALVSEFVRPAAAQEMLTGRV
jgi:hypothetical protein